MAEHGRAARVPVPRRRTPAESADGSSWQATRPYVARGAIPTGRLADLATAALAVHVNGPGGGCTGCSKVLGKSVAWPCSFVSLANLAIKIAKGEIGER
jgi:hypothetical protein